MMERISPMKTPRRMRSARIDSSLKLVATYAGFGALWIVVSDGLLSLETGAALRDRLQDTAKGLLFIAITAVLLYVLVRRLVRRHLAIEDELREARARWQFALRSAGTGYWEWDEAAGTVYFSPEWKGILGYADEDLPNRQEEWLSRIHPDDKDRVTAQMHRHMTGESSAYECEYRMQAKDGTYRWILARGLVVKRDSGGRARQAYGTHTDITDRKTAEARTADALAFAKAVIHSSPMGIVTYGPDGNCVSANASAARLAGGEVPDLLRQNFRALVSWQSNGLLAVAEEALQTGTDKFFKGPLRTSFGLDRWIEARLVPFTYMGEGHLLVLLNDVTTERKTQDALQLLHAAVQAAPVSWVITDAGGVIEWVNPAFTRLTGYETAEAVGMKTSLLRSGRHPAEFYRQMWETIQRGETWAGEVCNRRKDGSLYEEHMTIAPVRDGDGRIRHFVAMKQDITTHKQLEQQLTRTQRLESIGMLASGIAHDLNNVLTPILLSIELLRTKYPVADAQKYVETVQSAAQRGAGIVRQVLTFARGVDGGERTEVQPRYLVNDVVHLIEETFPRNIEIRHEVARDVLPVHGDLTQLHQVILNLAVNARDAMPPGGTLTLAAHNVVVDPAGSVAHRQLKAGTYVALAVTDTGTGITPEVLEHMFEPFYTTKPRGKGTGLGLSTVYGIVRSHGGIIDVRTRLGQGTTFEVLLPAIAIPAAAGGTVDARAVLKGAGRRVLVVDDEEAIRNVTMRVLARHGFVPVMAVDGADGLKAFLANPRSIAVAIVDMIMPRMGGEDLARNLRLAAPGLPIIISTGMMGDDRGTEATLAGIGACTYLHKPYAEEELMKALAKALDQAGPVAAAGVSPGKNSPVPGA